MSVQGSISLYLRSTRSLALCAPLSPYIDGEACEDRGFERANVQREPRALSEGNERGGVFPTESLILAQDERWRRA